MKTNSKIFSAILIVGLISAFIYGCKKDDTETPKPISVNNTMTPTTIGHGGTIQWDIEISNLGEAIVVTKIHAKHVCISGWAKNQVLQDLDLPVTNISFSANETKAVFSSPVTLLNTGTTDVEVRNTVTAYFDGGSVSDDIIYKITKAVTKSGESKSLDLLTESFSIRPE